MAPGLSQLELISFPVTAYNNVKQAMDFYDSDHKDHFSFITDTTLKSFALSGQSPPHGFMSANAWAVMMKYYQSLASDDN